MHLLLQPLLQAGPGRYLQAGSARPPSGRKAAFWAHTSAGASAGPPPFSLLAHVPHDICLLKVSEEAV